MIINVNMAYHGVLYSAELHQRAYSQISKQATQAVSGGFLIDLHGLHSDEAIDFVGRKIDGVLIYMEYFIKI